MRYGFSVEDEVAGWRKGVNIFRDSDSDITLPKSPRIVEPIADHHDFFSFFLFRANESELVLRGLLKAHVSSFRKKSLKSLRLVGAVARKNGLGISGA